MKKFSAKHILFALTLWMVVGCSDDGSNYLVPFEQDPPEEKVTDVGTISKESFRPSLDILFVIDDSGSMSSHQANLAANIPKFTEAIAKAKFLDYHIGVVTSSANISGSSPTAQCCGKLNGFPTYVERSTPYGMEALASNILVGDKGDSTERFYEPVMQALTEPLLSEYNVGFYRPDSFLVLLFITDTDDQSSISSSQFYNFLTTLKGGDDRFFVGAAYIAKADPKCSGEGMYGKLNDFFKLAKGQTFSLCAPDYGQKLAAIGELIALKSQTMVLDRVPKQGTISITIGKDLMEENAKTGWSYNPVKNSIEFGPDIAWENYPDDTFPEINYEAIVFVDKK